MGASLYSLLDHNRQLPLLDIYILSVGMSKEPQQKLRSIAERFSRRLFVVELGNLAERFPYEINTRGFDISAMARLFAPQVLPKSVKRCLYLDCDTIVCGDIGELYHTELGSCLTAMVMEPTVYSEMKEAIGMKKDDAYFNSGVILMDLEGWRRGQLLQKMLEFYGNHAGSLFACDQDTINGTLKGRILSLPPKYNFFTNYRYFHYYTLLGLCGAYEQVGKAAFGEAKRSPVIIHYLGDERPWIAGNHNHYKGLYQWYLRQTPWKGMALQEGKRLYMQLWWVFNKISWLCPPFRLMVSRKMGMKVIDRRQQKKAAEISGLRKKR